VSALEQERLEAAIAGLQAQRFALGDAVVDAGVAALQGKIEALRARTTGPVLRQVSVLFADVVGSTALSRRLEPEDVQQLMDGALAAFTVIVEAHRGKVLQYAGDSLLAAFGAAEAREDDATQAVRCGLALLDESRRRSAAVPEFAIRVGVHTGGVLLGGGVDEDGTIRGPAVNVAARMEQSAPAGGLRISHDTYCHVRGIFDVAAQAPIAVKGIAEPLVTYLVERARPRAFRAETRGIEGVPTLTVGREAELGRLQKVFRSLLEKRCLHRVTVVGDAGIGKSRLLREFVDRIETGPERVLLLQGRATPQTLARPYGLLSDVIGWHFGIGVGDATGVAQGKLVAGVVPLLQSETGADAAEGHAHLLGHLIGIDFTSSRHVHGIVDDPLQIRSRGANAAVRVLRRLAATGGTPLVLQLEDVHWADGESLDFIDHLADVGADIPLLVVALARPTLFERRPAPATDRAGGERVDLGPLDAAASGRLASELLKAMTEIPAALRERLTGSAEGNPFYMEELVRMLVDQGAIDTGGAQGSGWRLDATRLVTARLPTTLTGIVQARLDELEPDERLALQQASVIGTVFWDRTLAALDARAPLALASLCRRELLRHEPDAPLEGATAFAFRHQILQQVTYDTLLRRERRALHAAAARWFATLAEARAGDFLATTAEHHERADEPMPAAEFYVRAAEHAGARYARDAAAALATRALAALDRGGVDAPAGPAGAAAALARALGARRRARPARASAAAASRARRPARHRRAARRRGAARARRRAAQLARASAGRFRRLRVPRARRDRACAPHRPCRARAPGRAPAGGGARPGRCGRAGRGHRQRGIGPGARPRAAPGRGLAAERPGDRHRPQIGSRRRPAHRPAGARDLARTRRSHDRGDHPHQPGRRLVRPGSDGRGAAVHGRGVEAHP
jgi:class 3 adenylate cyclase